MLRHYLGTATTGTLKRGLIGILTTRDFQRLNKCALWVRSLRSEGPAENSPAIQLSTALPKGRLHFLLWMEDNEVPFSHQFQEKRREKPEKKRRRRRKKGRMYGHSV